MYRLLHIARSLFGQGLIDRLRYRYHLVASRGKLNRFKKENPDLEVPPPYMLYESFKLDYHAYYTSGKNTARWVIDHCTPFIDLERSKILDWGCGPARVTRHIAKLLPSADVYGTDYNQDTIQWCRSAIENISFSENDITPPTNYANNKFDLIYGISIFTHLSEISHSDWLKELHRIVSTDGIVFITTHGDAHKIKLTHTEKLQYENGKMVFRPGEKEGHRTYTAFHPPQVFQNLLQNNFTVLKHEPGRVQDWGIAQDVWILGKV